MTSVSVSCIRTHTHRRDSYLPAASFEFRKSCNNLSSSSAPKWVAEGTAIVRLMNNVMAFEQDLHSAAPWVQLLRLDTELVLTIDTHA